MPDDFDVLFEDLFLDRLTEAAFHSFWPRVVFASLLCHRVVQVSASGHTAIVYHRTTGMTIQYGRHCIFANFGENKILIG
jgi:hypothetical protein